MREHQEVADYEATGQYLPQEWVKEFHKAFGIYIGFDGPKFPDEATCNLREELVMEEAKELVQAMKDGDIVGVADGLADLLYVVYGTAVSFGIYMPPVLAEVHRSNMTKVGGYKSPSGKWVKPDTYDPARLRPILEEQTEICLQRKAAKP